METSSVMELFIESHEKNICVRDKEVRIAPDHDDNEIVFDSRNSAVDSYSRSSCLSEISSTKCLPTERVADPQDLLGLPVSRFPVRVIACNLVVVYFCASFSFCPFFVRIFVQPYCRQAGFEQKRRKKVGNTRSRSLLPS